MINNILSGLYNQNNLLNTTVNVPEQVNSVQNELINSLLNLKEGMIFEAVVKNVNNNQILLSLADGQAVSARLESSDAFNVGDNVSFQVKSNENGQISIKSVPKSDYNNPAFLKALDAANMEATPKNLEMVKSMMEESLPINKQSLQNMHKLILNNPNAPIKNILNESYIREILETNGSAFSRPWFGQLMTGPQLIAYLCQVDMWLEKYSPKFEI